ncbi:MAG: threonylcarbamoyl-AMP synthase [Moorea sp. SIO3I7]|uniref:L-threonylcarbamoyladenylate synthase n=1 Tax=unclassified Moorena TaxID=2683338 RepID=UPI0013C18E18|nr:MULTISPECIES: L-threonylcarbamoyladenylate synthase [unclassified Moorena]NEN95229.1 threonylcarbamoyl-AMP synthase [Moorena sp. SIO3I7]NEO04963.1 threonylcarbamoyl-AMP synthase [Moorena sp. SIO3I8]NEO12016.1 threonylcarbamoyl-AMP synthase [Moorena sp. SIO3E8]NEO18686.1 threonylcarbamoyl-AMP synthase [Moorena sp. SIO4A5]NEP24740.1 threonylcarbamoyl-AMP synthase [Moorena sp. SIO3I6]
MATIYTIHPETPQIRRIEKIREYLEDGAVMLYPTDTVYAIGCDLHVKSAVQRVRRLKQLSNDKPLTFLCSSLSNIAKYARVSDPAYRIMKHLIPGPYTFLLPATKLVPKLVMSPNRKTTGIRVPDHNVCQALLSALGHPIISTSAHLPNQDGDTPTVGLEPAKLFDALDGLVDIIVDNDLEPGFKVSTILDLTGSEPMMVRQGLGWDKAIAWI